METKLQEKQELTIESLPQALSEVGFIKSIHQEGIDKYAKKGCPISVYFVEKRPTEVAIYDERHPEQQYVSYTSLAYFMGEVGEALFLGSSQDA
jgi:hypothetical protein